MVYSGAIPMLTTSVNLYRKWIGIMFRRLRSGNALKDKNLEGLWPLSAAAVRGWPWWNS